MIDTSSPQIPTTNRTINNSTKNTNHTNTTTMLFIAYNLNSTTTCPTNAIISTSCTYHNVVSTITTTNQYQDTTIAQYGNPYQDTPITSTTCSTIIEYQEQNPPRGTTYRQRAHGGIKNEPLRQGPFDAMMQQIENLSKQVKGFSNKRNKKKLHITWSMSYATCM